MAFRLPNFNLMANVWRQPGGAYASPDVTAGCNLSQGRRALFITSGHPTGSFPQLETEILFPKLTDVRAAWNGLQNDIVEVPAGSKRFYSVRFVDDVAKGFANEYRLVIVEYNTSGAFTFPAPVPLP